MFGIVGEIIGHTRKQVLVAFTRQQVTIGQRFLAEFGQQRIAALVGLHVEPAIEHLLAVMFGRFRGRAGDRAGQRLASGVLHQIFAALVRPVHGDRFLIRGGFGGGVVLCFDIQCHRRVVPAFEIHRQPRHCGAPPVCRCSPDVPLVFESARRASHLAKLRRSRAETYPVFPHNPGLGGTHPIWGALPPKARSCGLTPQTNH